MDLSLLGKALKFQPPYRLRQAQEAVFRRLIESWEEATDLPEDLRQKLAEECPLEIRAKILKSKRGDTIKAAIELKDGAVVEAVLMRHKFGYRQIQHQGGGAGRNTVCLSSQVGCPCACDFCATGKMGFIRQMKAEEILEQALFFARLLKEEGQKIGSAVFMGMGEPLLNYNEVMKAVGYLNDQKKFSIGARHISISTVGIPDGIEQLSKEKKQVNLAFSLHTADEALRHQLIPISRRYPFVEIFAALERYIQATGRRVMIEYLLLQDVNDSPKAARDLAKLLRRSLSGLFFVNLISFNPTRLPALDVAGYGGQAGQYRPSSPEKTKIFQSVLFQEGIAVTCRYRFGEDIQGACGQLAGRKNRHGLI